MKLQVRQNKLRDEIKKAIFDGFSAKAIEATGIDGLKEAPISFEVFNGDEFVGAIVVQPFWGQLHIKYLFVEKPYRGQGIASNLMNHALEFGRQRGYRFAFVETLSFQAPDFYQRMGFEIEFSRPGYEKGTSFHYLKKDISKQAEVKQVTRFGVYGVSLRDDNILLVRQNKGPYAGKFDFPGGGIEFGESPEQTLRREYLEEVGMEFHSLQLINNITAVIDVPASSTQSAYTFFHVGMIYGVEGCSPIKKVEGELIHSWVDPKTLSEDQCSALLWKFIKIQHTDKS